MFLYLFVGSELADIVEVEPFLKAFLILIVIPLALAWALQAWAAHRASGQKVSDAATTMMVPLMAATLLVVVASQVPKLGDSLTAVIPFYAAFLMVMAFAGKAIARLFRLEAPAGRAIVLTGATHNSLDQQPLPCSSTSSTAPGSGPAGEAISRSHISCASRPHWRNCSRLRRCSWSVIGSLLLDRP